MSAVKLWLRDQRSWPIAPRLFAAPPGHRKFFEKLERLLVEERKTNVFAVFFHFIFTIYNRGDRAILSLL